MNESAEWTQEAPTEPGIYIFTGWTMQRHSPPHFVKVHSAGSGVVYELNGYILTKETRGGWWLKVPALPPGVKVSPLQGEE